MDLPDRYVHRALIPPSRRELEREVFRETAYRAAHALLDVDPPPSAVFANFDLVAAAVLTVARERGIRVPDDLAVVGFDDSDFAAFLGLTTVRQHLFKSGRIAFQLLREQLKSSTWRAAESVSLPLDVVPRSTA